MNPPSDPVGSGLPEDCPVPTPESFIGQIINSNGQQHRIEGIEAIGSKFVVYRLLNLATDTVDQVCKVGKEEFDPRVPLMNGFRDAMSKEYDADRFIRICERLMVLDPESEAWPFNLGVAHHKKNDLPRALAAFERALAIAPQDYLNLFYRASCLALLGRDEECFKDFMQAADHDEPRLREILAEIKVHPQNIKAALERLARQGPSKSAASRALYSYF
jgi:tetratricopeptide (TPR) repeat protein